MQTLNSFLPFIGILALIWALGALAFAIFPGNRVRRVKIAGIAFAIFFVAIMASPRVERAAENQEMTDAGVSSREELAAMRAAEQERIETAQRAESAALREAEEVAKVSAYIEQLDREIASIPSVQASKYTEDITTINTGLLLIGAWALLYERGENLILNEEARQKRQQFRQLLVRKQADLLPAMRDAYGPAMRQQLWEADGSARTIGAGYRTVEFVSAAFARNANIQQIHLEIRENLMMLRFTRAQYKWFERASDFSYYTLEVPRDSDVVKWESGGRYRVLD
jgi:hypothetical protein